MTVSTCKRVVLFIAGICLLAPMAFADYPSIRVAPRMVYDPTTSSTLLFGGQTPLDGATNRIYGLAETWIWNGSRWTQRYTPHVPPGRAAQSMVWDSLRNRAVMFGGNDGSGVLGDTWTYHAGDWTRVDSASSPSARKLGAAAYDVMHDRVILFGGQRIASSGTAFEDLYDTWEFDGTSWTQVNTAGPQINKPVMAYDPARDMTVLLGTNSSNVVSMWSWDSATRTWKQMTPAALPACLNESGIVFQNQTSTLVISGGICSNTAPGSNEEVWEWNGTTWNKFVPASTVYPRVFGHAMTYDIARSSTLSFGGTNSLGANSPAMFVLKDGDWSLTFDARTPGPRSRSAVATDPITKSIFLYGGIADNGNHLGDFWQYRNGGWQALSGEGQPVGCIHPQATWDTDRSRYVLFCGQSSYLYELDPAATVPKWEKFELSKNDAPPNRRLAAMTYDASLKKTVLNGGFNDVEYLDDTWLWDGKTWSEVKKNRMPARSLAAMWFDPTLKKTVAYGGIGRPNRDDRIKRYDDMYAFDANGWTKLTPSTSPGARYGAQAAVDPRTNTVILTGGIFYTEPAQNVVATQTFMNDTWEWNGTNWTKLSPTPFTARENASMAFDPISNELLLFGGYAGVFYSDVWALDAKHTQWRVRSENLARRRASSGGSTVTP